MLKTIDAMDDERQIDLAEIRKLLSTGGPCITIVLTGSEAGDMRAELRDAISMVREKLGGNVASPEIEALLEPLATMEAELAGNANRRGPFMILRSPGTLVQMRVLADIRPGVTVGDHFDARALLAAVGARKRFYVLALSQNRTRVLACTNESCEEIPLPVDFPTNLHDFMQTERPDHTLEARSSAGPSTGAMKGVLFGTLTDRESKDQYLLHFFMAIDRHVGALLKNSKDPLVPVAVEHELALYRRVNTYSHLVEPGIHGSPDGLGLAGSAEIHALALEALKDDPADPRRRLLEGFDKKVGNGHASSQLDDIAAAARDGRVSHLFFQDSGEYMESSARDLLQDAAVQTVLHGGDAFVMPSTAMPDRAHVCAIFRYPGPKTPPVE